MSRCFPFPPPGYEKKPRVEEIDLLAKEKHKEKKNKKDKKDKEKREVKEKNKDKERSKDKHSDKKDQKEKHKDKKEKDKDRDKNRTSDAKRIEGQPECYNGEKLGPNSLQPNGIGDSKYVQDLARRIRDEDGAAGSQVGQKITVTDQRRAELPGRMVEHNANKLEEKEKAKDKKDDDKKVNGQRNHTEARCLGNATVQGLSGMDQKRFQGIVKPVEKNDIRKQMEEKEKEKNKHNESESKGDKHKDRDREKKSRSKDKNKNKEKRKEEKAKEINGPSKDQLKLKDSSPKLKDNSPKLKHNGEGFPNSCNVKPPDILKMSSSNPASEGSLGKRKELEINGISYDNGIRPNKLPRPVLSSHSIMENGGKLEPCQTDAQFTSETRGTWTNNRKVDVKEHKINGLMEVPQPVKSSAKPLSAVGKVGEKPLSTVGQVSEKTLSTVGQVNEKPLSTVAKVSENGEASAKPLHPDSKYLSQILSLPEMGDRYDLDDQEWLFCSNSVHSKKPKVGSPGVDATQNVWAEVLWIEYADVTALPFVIPY